MRTWYGLVQAQHACPAPIKDGQNDSAALKFEKTKRPRSRGAREIVVMCFITILALQHIVRRPRWDDRS